MAFISIVKEFTTRVGSFIAPRYRPEKHYMRGFGPASAARQVAARH